MTDDTENKSQNIVIPSSRFGDLEVPADSVISFDGGLIGFPSARRYIMLDYKPPFSWLHAADDPNLAFVVIDGAQFGENYRVDPPFGNKECDLKEDDEFAILVIVTVRPNARETTANLKAPIFVNIRNRKGVQVIYDNPNLSTRHPLWAPDEDGEGEKK